ncbi:MAG: hypothetical protein J5750_07305 [Clostridiales bacterium]|nr:hypothetical protein [Clostridiales bacterium]
MAPVAVIRTAENLVMELEENGHRAEQPVEFAISNWRGVRYHGRITEIERHEIFNSKWHKFCNALFRGEPFQLAHQTSEYTIRIENIGEDYPTEVADVCLYGNYLGRMHIGDEVEVDAKNYGNRRVGRSVYNHTTGSVVRPGLQIPAGTIRIFFSLIMLVMFSLVVSLFNLVRSGELLQGLIAVVSMFLPFLIAGWILWYLVRGLLRRE